MRNFGTELAKGAGAEADKQGKEVGKRFGKTALLGIGVVAGGAAVAGKALYAIGETFDEVTDTIRVGTGATGKDLDKLVASAKNVGSKVPASFEDIGTVVADVNTRLGLTGPTLEKFSSQALEAGRIMGEEIDINAMSSAFSSFKIEGEKTTGAMDHLFRVSQATGVGMNDLAKQTAENAPAMQTLGFSFEETAGMVGALDKAGLNSSKTMNGMSKALVTLAKDGEEPKEAFKRTTQEMQSFIDKGDDAGALNLASKLFGTRNASQFVGALKSGKVNMEDLGNVAGMTGDTILEAGADTADFAEKWQVVKNKALLAVAPVAERVFGAMADGADMLLDKVIPAAEKFVDEWQKGVGAGGKFRDVLTRVGGALKAAAGFLVEHKKAVAAVVVGYLAFKVVMGVMRAYNAVMGVAKGVQLGYAIATGTATTATKAGTAAEKVGLIVGKAKLVMMKAVTIATKAWAVAQRVLNAVMRMNPIGLVVTALIALGAGLVLAYKKSETFRRIVDAAWAGVKKAVKVVVDWWTGTAWPAIKKFFTSIGTSMVSAKNKVVGAWDSIKAKVVAVKDWITNTAWPALKSTLYKLSGFIPVVAIYRNWDKITGKFKAAWNWVKGTFRTWWSGVKQIFTNPIESAKTIVTRLLSATGLRKPILAVWTWVRDTFKRSWAGIKKIFTDPIESARTIIQRILGKLGLQKTFQSARDALGRIWGGLKKKLTSPMVSILKWMNSGFIGKLNGMLGKIKVKFRIEPIVLPKGFATGGWTGPGSKYAPAGVVHADEFVVKKSSRNKFERDNPGTLDHINRFGTLPGYAIGGKVGNLNKKFLAQLSAFNEAAGGRYSVNSGYRSNAHQQILYNRYLAGNGPVAAKPGSSMHNRGLAADLAPSDARNVHGPLAALFGLSWTVPSESWHIEPNWGRGSGAGPSSGGGGGGFSLGSLIPEWVRDTAGWLKKKFANATAGFSKDKFGLAGEMVPPVFTAMKDAVKKRAMSAASVFGIGGGDSGGGSFDFSKIKGATNMALGQGMAASMGWKGAQWTALKELWRRESGWNHLAKNPSSGAYGIPQALPASKMASVMQGGGSDYLTNPRTQMSWGLRYIQGRHRNPAAALAFHDRVNWYADGGRVQPAVFDNGGTLAPGLNLVNNKLGKPEALVRPEQMAMGPITVNVTDRDGLIAQFVDGRIDTARTHDDRMSWR